MTHGTCGCGSTAGCPICMPGNYQCKHGTPNDQTCTLCACEILSPPESIEPKAAQKKGDTL